MNKAQVINLAKDLQKKDGYIDVIKLAEKLNIEVYVVDQDNPDFNAQIQHIKDDGFEILVNEKHPETRRRFSIAHEISHYILDKPAIIANKVLERTSEYKDEAEKQSEQRADDLAAEILMPKEIVDEYLETEDITPTTKFTAEVIIDIARYFRVSKEMAITRLRNLGFVVPYIEFA